MTKLSMKSALLGGALFALTPAALMAQTAGFIDSMPAEGHLTSEMVGAYVYSGAGEEAEAIGDVNNLVIGSDGSVQAVIVGVGGFLGVGEKNVAVSYDQFEFASDGDGDNDQRIVLETTKESLEQAPEFTYNNGDAYSVDKAYKDAERAYGDAVTAVTGDDKPADDTMAADGSTDQTMAANDATTDMDASSGSAELATIQPTEIDADQLIGHRVYTMNDEEWIGEVGDVVMTGDGDVDAVVVDFGGFLGIGEKPIAVGFDALTFKDDGDNDGDYYVYVNLTKEQLDEAPTYDAASYESNRDAMRVQ